MIGTKTDKQALQEWDEFLEGIRNDTAVEAETEEEKIARIKRLEAPGNEEEWFKYHFSKYCFAEPAPFHKNSTKKVLSKKRLRQSRKWCRGMSKSTRRMFEILYMKFVKKMNVNMLLISKNEANAIRLLAPYRGHLEANQKLINDYGLQTGNYKWAEEEFITRDRCSFRAVGMGQNPRGAKLDELRINIIVFDDADDDEVCENVDRLNKNWNWILKAAIPTVEISRDFYLFFDNNVIAEDCLANRFAEIVADPDSVEVVNLTDDNGNSTWDKNSDEDIKYMLDGLSYEAIQTEFYNNPMSSGKTFPDIKFGKCPAIQSLPFVIQYADPSTSNNDKPTLKSKAQNSTKANVLIGQVGNKFYVYKVWVNNTTNSEFIDWLYQGREYVGNKTALYTFIENNSLQDPFFQQVLRPLIHKAGNFKGGPLMVLGDNRVKPQKWFRIEASLEPINREGNLIFNIDEIEDPHMKRIVAQFKNAKATSKLLDGPDAVEGGVFKSKEKYQLVNAGGIKTTPRSRSDKKHV